MMLLNTFVARFGSLKAIPGKFNYRYNHINSKPKILEILHENEIDPRGCKQKETFRHVALMTDFKIHLEPSIQSRYNITNLSGSVLNLQSPGPSGYKRPNLSKIQEHEDFLTNWWIKQRMLEKDSRYYLKFKNNFATLSHLTIPSNTIPSDLIKCHTFFLGWTFQHDDVMDNLKDHKTADFLGGFETVAKANKVFCAILQDEYGRKCQEDNFPASGFDFPLFKPLCHTWRDFHALLNQHIPHYESRNGPFLKYMFEYFDSYVLSHGEQINRRFSEESGKYWLRFATGFKPWMELILLIKGVDLPRRVRKDFYYIRLRSASEDVVGFINDLFGVTKDLLNEEVDTLVMFKHIEKGIPLAQAYGETVEFLNDQIKDIMLLIQILRKRYPEDPNVEGFLQALMDFIDGYIIWCSTCRRYGGKTVVSYRTVEIQGLY